MRFALLERFGAGRQDVMNFCFSAIHIDVMRGRLVARFLLRGCMIDVFFCGAMWFMLLLDGGMHCYVEHALKGNFAIQGKMLLLGVVSLNSCLLNCGGGDKN